MPAQLSGSVGSGGRNVRTDVVVVQSLLTQKGQRPGPADGLCGQRTVAAIRAFQATFMRMPDGLINVGGITWQRLNGAGAPGAPGAPVSPSPPASPGSAGFAASMTQTAPRPAAGTFNSGLTAVSNSWMRQNFGMPRETFSQECQPITNPTLRRNVVSDSVGPFSVTGLRPAVDSLKQVFAEINTAQPDLYRLMGTAGMLCCRYQRGSTTAISNHSWGAAIDLKINGVLDRRGDNQVQVGLTLIAPIFNRHGWYWGAMFGTEDAMHFEASRSLAEKFKTQFS
ncbi:MAG TPA: M15 family metallopeptidase [Vineibacter sp.]|nr:M15 family metallopeptidase [Vineibacter sp.]